MRISNLLDIIDLNFELTNNYLYLLAVWLILATDNNTVKAILIRLREKDIVFGRYCKDNYIEINQQLEAHLFQHVEKTPLTDLIKFSRP